MVKNLKITSLHSASQIASAKNTHNAWVSIVDPEDYEVVHTNREANERENPMNRCNFFAAYFYDVEEAEVKLTHMMGPDEESVGHLVNFLRGIADSPREYDVLIHCYAGACRSTAAGFILLRLCGRDNPTALKELLEITPFAWPNTLILKLADEKLGYTGENSMEAHVNEWKRKVNGKLFTGQHEDE